MTTPYVITVYTYITFYSKKQTLGQPQNPKNILVNKLSRTTKSSCTYTIRNKTRCPNHCAIKIPLIAMQAQIDIVYKVWPKKKNPSQNLNSALPDLSRYTCITVHL